MQLQLLNEPNSWDS